MCDNSNIPRPVFSVIFYQQRAAASWAKSGLMQVVKCPSRRGRLCASTVQVTVWKPNGGNSLDFVFYFLPNAPFGLCINYRCVYFVPYAVGYDFMLEYLFI